jgi:hypothetical protein
MRGAAPQNGPDSKSVGQSAPAQNLLLGDPVAQAGDLVADATARLADVGSAGEVLKASSDAVLRSTATMTVPLAREAAFGSIIAATEQAAPEAALGSISVVKEQAAPKAAIGVFVDKSGAVAQSGAEPIVFAGEAREAAPQGDTMTRFMSAMAQDHGVSARFMSAMAQDHGVSARFMSAMAQDHGVSAHEAVAEPHVGAPQIAFDPSARFFETLVARGGAVLDGAETVGGTVVDTLAEATGGGALSNLTSPPAVEHTAAQPIGQASGVIRAQVIDQVIQGVKVAQHNESTEIVVHLKPAFLGKLSIRVVADEHGMRVEIQAENQIVRQIMQDNLADLQQRLSEKGLALDQFSVFAEAGSHPERETARSFEEPDNGSTAGASAALGADLAETTSAVSSGGIDYFA